MAFLDNLDDLYESQRLEFKEAAFELPQDVWESTRLLRILRAARLF